METEQTESGCVDALLVGHVGSRFTISFMVMLNLLLQVRKVQIKLQMERKRTMHLLL
jgi:MinD superfamily P-loop ATPase